MVIVDEIISSPHNDNEDSLNVSSNITNDEKEKEILNRIVLRREQQQHDSEVRNNLDEQAIAEFRNSIFLFYF